MLKVYVANLWPDGVVARPQAYRIRSGCVVAGLTAANSTSVPRFLSNEKLPGEIYVAGAYS